MPRMRMLAPVFGAVLLQACYVYTPLYGSAPSPGDRYVFHISDQGRVGLADRLGAGVEKVEGRLVGREGDAYLLSVTGVESIGAGATHWGGERVAIREGYVARVDRRQFSRGRTIVATGAAAAALAVFIATRQLLAGGGGQMPSTPTPGSGGQ